MLKLYLIIKNISLPLVIVPFRRTTIKTYFFYLFVLLICYSCNTQSNEIHSHKNLLEDSLSIDSAAKVDLIKIPASYSSDFDSVFLLENHQCYFRKVKRNTSTSPHALLNGDVTFLYHIKNDTLTFQMGIEKIQQKNGRLQIDTLTTLYKIRDDSLIQITEDNLRPKQGNKILHRVAATYQKIK